MDWNWDMAMFFSQLQSQGIAHPMAHLCLGMGVLRSVRRERGMYNLW